MPTDPMYEVLCCLPKSGAATASATHIAADCGLSTGQVRGLAARLCKTHSLTIRTYIRDRDLQYSIAGQSWDRAQQIGSEYWDRTRKEHRNGI